jgi:hypothetical protein
MRVRTLPPNNPWRAVRGTDHDRSVVCARCLRKTCRRCSTLFRSHAKGGLYCSDACQVEARRESGRQAQKRYRLRAAAIQQG